MPQGNWRETIDKLNNAGTSQGPDLSESKLTFRHPARDVVFLVPTVTARCF